MKRVYTILISAFLLLSITAPHSASGNHIMGADITWECVGNDSFEVTLAVYYDCTGTSLTKPGLSIGCKSGTLGSITQKELSYNGGKDITPTCESSCSQCGTGSCSFQYGIEKQKLTYMVDLSNSNCCKVNFNYGSNDCCRSNKISTGLAHDDFYVESWMNRCAAPCNSSPQFKEPPLGILCKDQQFVYNQGATDDDTDANGNLLDSLSYSFARPLGDNATDYLSYTSPYNHQEPFAYRGGSPVGAKNLPPPFGFHLDNNTGDIQFTPTKKQVSVMAFTIDEYRDTNGNGKKQTKVSQIRRDVQFFVIKCPNNKAPTITGMECPKETFYKEICAGSQSTFTFCTSDKNGKDSVNLSFNRGNLPGSPSFTIKKPNVKNPTGELKWTPQQQHASPTPYQFTVSAVDDNCPVPGRSVESYRLKVKPIPKASYNFKYQLCGKYKFSAKPIEGNNMKFTWSGDGGLYANKRDFLHQFEEPGTFPFKLTVTANGCSNVYRDTIELDPFLRVDIGNDTTLCDGSDITLGGKAKDNQGPVSYKWHDGKTTSQSRSFKNLQKDTIITLTVTDTVCSYTDTVKINTREKPEITLGKDPRICADDTFTLAPELMKTYDTTRPEPWVYVDGGQQVAALKWFKNQITASPYANQDSIAISSQGDFILKVADSFRCTNNDTIHIKTNPELNPTAQPQSICRGDTSNLSANKTGGPNVTYTWTNLRTNQSYKGQNINVWPDSNTTYALVVEESTKGVYCRDSATVSVEVKDLPDVSLSSIPNVCSNADPVDLSNYATPGAGSWKVLGSQQDPVPGRKTFKPDLADPGIYNLEYTYQDPGNDCFKSKTTTIRVLDLPSVDAGQDQIICTHEGEQKLNPSPVSPSTSQWTVGDGVQQTGNTEWAFDPNAGSVSQGPQILVYAYTEPAPDQCTNYDTLKMTVQNSPQPTIQNQEVCIDQQEVDLYQVSNNVSWYGTNVRDSQFFETPNSPGSYDVSYLKSNQLYKTCTIDETIQYKVNDTPSVTAATRSRDTRFCEQTATIDLRGTQSMGGANAGKWTMISDGQLNGTQFSPENNGPGEYTFAYQYTDPRTQCANQDRLTITVDTLPEVTLQTNDNIKCVGQTYSLEATFDHADNITWTSKGRPDGEGFANVTTNISEGTTSATYEPNRPQKDQEVFRLYIRADKNNICKTVQDSIRVKLKPQPRPDFSADQNGCPPFVTRFKNESVISSSGEIVDYKWQLGDGTSTEQANPRHRYEKPGEYTVSLVAESRGSCVNQIEKPGFIKVYQPPQPNFTADPTLTTIATPSVDFTNQTQYATEQTQYKWHFNDDGSLNRGVSREENPTHRFTDTGKYTISLVAQGKHCNDTMTKANYIEINPNVIIFAPNAFTPDGDGSNDVYRVEADNFRDFEIAIFNRWGEEIYHADSYKDHIEEGWDGTYKGQKVPSNSYMYVIKTVGFNGEESTTSGTINLIR